MSIAWRLMAPAPQPGQMPPLPPQSHHRQFGGHMQYCHWNKYLLISFFSGNGAIQEYVHHSFNVCWVTKLPQTYREIQQFVRSLLEEQIVYTSYLGSFQLNLKASLITLKSKSRTNLIDM